MAGPRQQYTGASIYLSPNTSELASRNVPAADRIWFYDQSAAQWTFLTVGANLAISGTTLNATGVAPVGAEYLVKVADATLTAERVVTDTPSITWDWSDATKAKANVIASTTKVYRALMFQSGTSAPVATVLENTLGAAIVWTYSSNGDYYGTLTGAFPFEKTFLWTVQYPVYVYSPVSDTTEVLAVLTVDTNNTVRLQVGDGFGVGVDSSLDHHPVEILVYA